MYYDQASSQSLFGRNRDHHCVVKQQLEFVAQTHSPRDALAIFRRIVASQQERINGSDRRPYLVMSRKEGDLFSAHPLRAYQGRANARTNLDEDILAGADSGDFLRHRAIGQHPVEEVGQRHAASQRLNRVEVRSC